MLVQGNPENRHEYTAVTPVSTALDLLQRLRHDGQRQILVFFSAGKDSTVVLDLCTRVFGPENVQPVHLYLLPDLRCEQEPVSRVLHHYPGIRPTIELPRPGLREILATSDFRPRSPSISNRFQRKSAWNERAVEVLVRHRTGIPWIAYGHRIFDSLNRRGMLHRCQGYWEKSYRTGEPVRRIYPVYNWHPQDIFSYLKHRKLPIPDMFGKQWFKTSGVSPGDPAFVRHLQEHYPDDYVKLKRYFPDIDDSIHRDAIRARHGIEHSLPDELIPPA